MNDPAAFASTSALAARFAEQRARLERAARAAGRAPESVRLLAVSKKHPAETIRAAYAIGQRDFGENYVQELVEKAEALRDLRDLRWHLIGHLQSNKAKSVAPFVHSVQSVGSVALVSELGKRVRTRRAVELGALDVLVEVNVGDESSKSGCSIASAREIVDAIDAEEGLRLRGLMTIPPAVDDASGSRPFFDELARLRDELGGAARLPELSMGMSHDADIAIAAGATCVRIGTALFGAR